jgi:SAM-dependent methyltransferase
MQRGYQHDFASMHKDELYDEEKRTKKADTMIAVLANFYGQEKLKTLKVLDVGASTGFIDYYLAGFFEQVVGIDIDEQAIAFASEKFNAENLVFKLDDAMKLSFDTDSFDVVVCSQVYEHVPDAQLMFSEIYRVLKPGGVCYFAAGNRLNVKEHHYGLPFLSVMPRFLAHYYIRIFGKADFYYEKHLSYWGLMMLVNNFIFVDFTRAIIADPEKFKVN